MLALLILPLWLFLLGILNKRHTDLRDSFLAACAIWGVALVALTEGLSLFNAISFWPVLNSWLLISFGVTVLYCFSEPEARKISLQTVRSRLGGDKVQLVFVSGIGVTLLMTGCVALVSAPNNWDSMTYHLTRVLNWMDHHSLRNYPTHDLRQLYLGPWAEFVILHLQVLSGGDRFAACVQFFSMFGSIVGVSRIAGRLGATGRGQLFASVCCATIPMGILQGSSTQNDYVTSFWLVCFLNGAMDLIEEGVTWGNSTLAGASLGLTALTKTSGVLFAAPFIIWIAASICSRRGAVWALATLSWMALWITVIDGSHLHRNWVTFGSLLEPPDEAFYQNNIHSPAAIASNVVRNLAVHATGLPRGQSVAIWAVRGFHQLIRWNITDPRTTFLNTRFELTPYIHEDTAGNPLHLVLEGLAIVVCLWSWHGGSRRNLYAVCICAGFLLFCVILKWQPWISRLQLPLFVAATPIAGVASDLPRLRRWRRVIGSVLLLAGLIPASRNFLRPLATHSSILSRTRTSLYFAAHLNWEGSYVAAVSYLSTIPSARVGVVCSCDSWEYPLRLLAREANPGIEFEYTEVRNSSAHAALGYSPSMRPSIILKIDRPDLDDRLRGVRPVFASGPISMYRFPVEEMSGIEDDPNCLGKMSTGSAKEYPLKSQ